MFGMGGSFDKPSLYLSKKINGNRDEMCTEKYTCTKTFIQVDEKVPYQLPPIPVRNLYVS